MLTKTFVIEFLYNTFYNVHVFLANNLCFVVYVNYLQIHNFGKCYALVFIYVHCLLIVHLTVSLDVKWVQDMSLN